MISTSRLKKLPHKTLQLFHSSNRPDYYESTASAFGGGETKTGNGTYTKLRTDPEQKSSKAQTSAGNLNLQLSYPLSHLQMVDDRRHSLSVFRQLHSMFPLRLRIDHAR